ncbi:hypothetical protein HK102_002223 [Quaeritorhiza haematococci]|nr:hypothetical protein HK102_002223 [Quaeritorhiza haematococci]
MLRRQPTSIELKAEDLNEFEEIRHAQMTARAKLLAVQTLQKQQQQPDFHGHHENNSYVLDTPGSPNSYSRGVGQGQSGVGSLPGFLRTAGEHGYGVPSSMMAVLLEERERKRRKNMSVHERLGIDRSS